MKKITKSLSSKKLKLRKEHDDIKTQEIFIYVKYIQSPLVERKPLNKLIAKILSPKNEHFKVI
jgi:hypothetical protein